MLRRPTPKTQAASFLFALLALAGVACGGSIDGTSTNGDPTTPGAASPGDPGGPGGSGPGAAPQCVDDPSVVTLGSGEDLRPGVAVNATNVFWSQGIDAEALETVPKAGGAASTLLASGGGRVAAADAAAVYVVTGAGNSDGFGLVRVPLDGGPTTSIVSSSTSITSVTVDDARVYWAASGQMGDCFGDACQAPVTTLLSAPKTGGDVTTLASGLAVDYLKVDDTFLYFASSTAGQTPSPSTQIGRIRKSGGTATAIVTQTSRFLQDLELDGEDLYWTESDLTDASPSRIARIAKDANGGSVAQTVATTATKNPRTIAVDATNVYWLDETQTALLSAPKSGGAPVVVASGQPAPNGGYGDVVADATGIYWIVGVACGRGCPGSVRHIAPACR